MNMQKHVGFFEFSSSIIASVILMLFFFQNFDFRVLVFFGIFLSLFEFFVQMKFRLGMSCSHCGFDPLLYIKSKDKACAQVTAHLESRKNDPNVYLSARPTLDLPTITTKKDSLGREKRTVSNPLSKPHVARNLDLKL